MEPNIIICFFNGICFDSIGDEDWREKAYTLLCHWHGIGLLPAIPHL
jgi:hypothetical protein